jgi:non-ribosomal peptide synthetase component F
MRLKANVAVIFHGAADVRGCRLALAVAEGAWDAGAVVRVRRMDQLAAPAGARSEPEWAELLREVEDLPEATADDLAWADAVLLGTSSRDGAARAQLGRFVDAVLPSWEGVVVPFGSLAPRIGEEVGGTPIDRADVPSAAELAEARDEGRRVAEAVHELKGGRPPLADVA